MSRYATSSFASLVLLGTAAIVAIGSVSAGNPVGLTPAVRGPEIMFYVNQSLWSRKVSLPMFGFRLDRLRSIVSNSIKRTTLIDFQFLGHSDVRVEFARRLTWNIGRGDFGSQAISGYLQMPTKNSMLADPLTQPPGDAPSFRTNPLAADILRGQQAAGGGHPFESGFIDSRWPLTESWGGREFHAAQQSATKMKTLSFGSVRCCAG